MKCICCVLGSVGTLMGSHLHVGTLTLNVTSCLAAVNLAIPLCLGRVSAVTRHDALAVHLWSYRNKREHCLGASVPRSPCA